MKPYYLCQGGYVFTAFVCLLAALHYSTNFHKIPQKGGTHVIPSCHLIATFCHISSLCALLSVILVLRVPMCHRINEALLKNCTAAKPTGSSLCSMGSLSRHFNGHFPGGPGLARRYQNVSILDFIGAKDDGGVGDNRSYKRCEAPNRHQQQTNSQLNSIKQ